MYTIYILTLTTLYNHVHQFQSFSPRFHLQHESNFYMSWQLKTLSKAIMCYSWRQVPKSLLIIGTGFHGLGLNCGSKMLRKFCASHSSFQIPKENQGAIISFPEGVKQFLLRFCFPLPKFVYLVRPALHGLVAVHNCTSYNIIIWLAVEPDSPKHIRLTSG